MTVYEIPCPGCGIVVHTIDPNAADWLVAKHTKEQPMPKDDPLQTGRTLWLDADSMEQARENFWRAYEHARPTTVRNLDDRDVWDVAWAAAIAAFDYMMNGTIQP